MKKILPMSEPIVDSYPGYGGAFSILGVHTTEHLPWVYNFFVQLATPQRLSEGNRINYVAPDAMTISPWLKSIYIDRKLSLQIMNVVELIKSYIDQEYYFYASFDVSQIAAYKRKELFHHECLIYGYDDEKEEFYFADNYQKGKYAHGVASYKEIEIATKNYMLTNYKDGFRGIRYMEKNELKYFEFDKRAYIDFMIDYIEEKDSGRRWRAPGIILKVNEGRKWGVGVYSYMQDYLNKIQKEEREIDIRGFYVIKEHKFILEKSLTYVLGEKWKEKYPDAWQLLEKDISMTTIALNLCLRFNLQRNEAILNKIRQYLSKIESNDKQMFPILISILETSQD